MAETSVGREVFVDDNGENYSEKTITFETEYGWINMPSVDAEGNQMSQEQLEAFVAENGPVDPVTGEELSTYEDVDSAVAAAERRTEDLGMEMEAQGMYHGGMPCGCGGDGDCGCDGRSHQMSRWSELILSQVTQCPRVLVRSMFATIFLRFFLRVNMWFRQMLFVTTV